MAFSLGDGEQDGMNEMNLIPLIDIMLVLMIIFLVTATVANPSIPLTLPTASAEVQPLEENSVTISIDAKNNVAWNGEVVSLDELKKRFVEASKSENKPSITLDADENSKYNTTAQVLSGASEVGLTNIAFATKN